MSGEYEHEEAKGIGSTRQDASEILGDSETTFDQPSVSDIEPYISRFNLQELLGGTENVRHELDNVFRETGYGSASSVGFQTLTGFNYHRIGQPLVHGNRDNMGFTFFTRPILNLTYDNLSAKRELSILRNAQPNTVARYVRNMLDPWGARGTPAFTSYGSNVEFYDSLQAQRYNSEHPTDYLHAADMNSRKSPMVDEYNPFIPLLSNTLVSLSGWKDVAINDYTSKAGIGNEQWAMPDGYFNIRDTFELNANFRNIHGDPITLLFQTWIQYYMGCRDMDLHPYPNFIYEREWDYNTKIYRFIMDQSRRYIQKYAATIAYPTSVSFGQQFNVDSSKNFVDTNSELPITFKCIGASYNDPILLYEFNEVVGEYCDGLKIRYDQYNYETQSLVVKDMESWVKLKPSELLRGTYFAIPLVNYITYELEWWVPRDKYLTYVYKEIKKRVVRLDGEYKEDNKSSEYESVSDATPISPANVNSTAPY